MTIFFSVCVPGLGLGAEQAILCWCLQNYEIECPDTKTLFSLKTGEITSW